jgi:serine protease Do
MENWNSDNDDKNNQEYQNVYYDSYFSNNENEIRVLKKKNKRKIYIIIYLIIGFVSVLIVMCVWSLKSNKMDFSDVLSQKIENNDIKPQESLKIPENLDAPQGLPASEIYKKCSKSVVGVFVTREGFSIFSGPMKQQVLGSGIIVKSNGYILTNAHVVEGCDQNSDISVTFSDKPDDKIKAKLIGRDRSTDIAIIKIDKNNLEAIPFGDSSKLEIGEQVYAIGSPSGLQGTITGGMISSLDRKVYDDVWSTNFIQTSTPINPGNSGGPLVDSSGRLVGVNTLKTADTEGIGFAIPVNDAVKIADDLINHGKVLRPAIGVTVNDNLVIERIADGSELSGKVSRGDMIIGINNKVVKNPGELVEEIKKYSIGDKVDISVQSVLLKKVISVKLRELN